MASEELKKFVKESVDHCTDRKRLELALALVEEYKKNPATAREHIEEVLSKK